LEKRIMPDERFWIWFLPHDRLDVFNGRQPPRGGSLGRIFRLFDP